MGKWKSAIVSITVVTGAWGCSLTGLSNVQDSSSSFVYASPTPADTLPELIEGLSNSDRADVQIVSAYALAEMGSTAEPALPHLINNLHNQSSEVQISAIRALAAIGSNRAVRPLIDLSDNDFGVVRLEIAVALGKLGDPSAVPGLVQMLDDEDTDVSAQAARAIGILTNQQFPGIFGPGGFELNEDGIPKAVIAAKEWWRQEGQHMSWPPPPQ